MSEERKQDLIRKAREGDEAALEHLVKAHADRLHEFIRHELGDRLRQRLESQDIMQQVYLDALHRIDQFVDQGHGGFFAWLKRIALNRICDVDRRAFRTAKRGPEVRAADLGGDASVCRLLDQVSGSVTSPRRRGPGRRPGAPARGRPGPAQ